MRFLPASATHQQLDLAKINDDNDNDNDNESNSNADPTK